MTWLLAIIAHVIVGALMTILARKLSLSNKKTFYVIGFMTFLMVSLSGITYSFIFGVPLDYFPDTQEWLYMVPASIGLASSWLLHYKTISLLGAGNAMIASMANSIGTAVLGFVFLKEGISGTFIIGAILILASIWLTFRIRPDEKHRITVSRRKIAIIIFGMAVAFSVGMMFEKTAIDSMGVWQYARYGWSAQFLAALLFVILFGRKELLHADKKTLLGAALLGIVLSIAGGFYIVALSTGSLSETILAASAKIALISILSYVFLRERNALHLRILALVLTTGGLWLII